MKKLILITLICVISYISGYWTCSQKYNFKTQAEMIHYSAKVSENYDEEFNRICNRITDYFKSDNDFIAAFNKDRDEFLKYRETHINTMLPAYLNTPTAYGTNYSIYHNSIKDNITANKILEYKQTIQTYCLYNTWQHPSNIYNKEAINNLFKTSLIKSN